LDALDHGPELIVADPLGVDRRPIVLCVTHNCVLPLRPRRIRRQEWVVSCDSQETTELMRQLEYRQGKPLKIYDLLAELHHYIEARPVGAFVSCTRAV
jgi:hypothetical protein